MKYPIRMLCVNHKLSSAEVTLPSDSQTVDTVTGLGSAFHSPNQVTHFPGGHGRAQLKHNNCQQCLRRLARNPQHTTHTHDNITDPRITLRLSGPRK